MKTFVWLFIIAGLFGIVIDIVYWFVARVEPAGVALLSVMTIALVFTAVYARFAESDAHLEGDRSEESAQDVAGEEIEVFTTQTPWPFLIALSALTLLVGVTWSPFVAGIGLIALILCFWRLGRESARL